MRSNNINGKYFSEVAEYLFFFFLLVCKLSGVCVILQVIARILTSLGLYMFGFILLCIYFSIEYNFIVLVSF